MNFLPPCLTFELSLCCWLVIPDVARRNAQRRRMPQSEIKAQFALIVLDFIKHAKRLIPYAENKHVDSSSEMSSSLRQ